MRLGDLVARPTPLTTGPVDPGGATTKGDTLRAFMKRRVRILGLVTLPVWALSLIVAAVAAAAGFAVLSATLSGQVGQATLGTDTQSNPDIVVTGTVANGAEPGAPAAVTVTWTNNSAVSETVHYPLTVGITTNDDGSPDHCNTYLSLDRTNESPASPATMTAGQVLTMTGDKLVVAANAPAACAGKTATITESSTVTP
jgi:hypothetical protein